MKIIISAFLFLLSLVIWQAFELKRRGESAPGKSAEQQSLPSDERVRLTSRTNNWPQVPKSSASSTEHRRHLQDILTLSSSADRAQASERWVDSLNTPALLEMALTSLLEAPEGERADLMRAFGPGLMSQWGSIAPQMGLLTWARMDRVDQWLLSDIAPPLDAAISKGSTPYPDALIDSWITHDLDGLISEMSRSDSTFLSDEFREAELKFDLGKVFTKAIEQEELGSLIQPLNSLESSASDASPLSLQAMSSLTASKLLSEYANLASAIEAAQELPPSPASERLVMDLSASQLAEQILRASRNDPGGDYASLAKGFQPLLRASSKSGRDQFFATLEKSSDFIFRSMERDPNPNQKKHLLEILKSGL